MSGRVDIFNITSPEQLKDQLTLTEWKKNSSGDGHTAFINKQDCRDQLVLVDISTKCKVKFLNSNGVAFAGPEYVQQPFESVDDFVVNTINNQCGFGSDKVDVSDIRKFNLYTFQFKPSDGGYSPLGRLKITDKTKFKLFVSDAGGELVTTEYHENGNKVSIADIKVSTEFVPLELGNLSVWKTSQSKGVTYTAKTVMIFPESGVSDSCKINKGGVPYSMVCDDSHVDRGGNDDDDTVPPKRHRGDTDDN